MEAEKYFLGNLGVKALPLKIMARKGRLYGNTKRKKYGRARKRHCEISPDIAEAISTAALKKRNPPSSGAEVRPPPQGRFFSRRSDYLPRLIPTQSGPSSLILVRGMLPGLPLLDPPLDNSLHFGMIPPRNPTRSNIH